MSALWVLELVWVVKALVFLYFISLNGLYLALLLLSVLWCRRYKSRAKVHPIDFDALPNLKELIPPVTIIVPAYNEERVIAQSVRSLLATKYARFEVVVVNDGSTDHTLDELLRSFSLHKAQVRPAGIIQTRPVRGIYASIVEPRLIVVDKQNGGKWDALNAGINFSQAPYFLAVDADSLV